MKKKLLSLALALSMTASLAAPAYAAEPAVSGNINGQEYTRWAKPVNSYLYDNGSGVTRVEWMEDKVVVEDYDADFRLTGSRDIEAELPLWGGFYAGEEYNFLFFGQMNQEEDDAKEVIRAVKYDKSWKRLGAAALTAANTVRPFSAGCLRCDEYQGYLYVRTCHEMYTSSDGLNHQSNMTLSIREKDMEITDRFCGVANDSAGYVSHSFNQFILVDGEGNIVTLDHGDAYPRAMVLMQYKAKAGEDKFVTASGSHWNSVQGLELTAFPGAVGNNSTGASAGGLAETESGYVTAYSRSESDLNGGRDVYLAYVSKGGIPDGQPEITRLTQSAAAGTPVLAPVDGKGGYVLWREADDGTIRYAAYDAKGAVSEPAQAQAALSDCQPIPYGGDGVVWYVTDGGAPRFYLLDGEGVTAYPEAEPQATAAPTATAKPTEKPKATATAKPTEKPKATATPKPTATAKPTPAPTPTGTSKPAGGSVTAIPTEAEAQKYVMEKGWMTGTDKGFAPTQTVSRASLYEMFWKMEGKESADGALNYTDIPAGVWYTQSARWATAKKLAQGDEARRYNGDRAMTRAEAVTALYRYMKDYLGLDVSAGALVSLEGFADFGKVQSWSVEPLKWARATGVACMEETDSTLAPEERITRAELARMLTVMGGEIDKQRRSAPTPTPAPTATPAPTPRPDPERMTLENYLSSTDEQWFLTGKTGYTIQGMMVGEETSFRNELEAVDYTVADDNVSVVLKGTAGEQWVSKVEQVVETYTKPNGTRLTREDFTRNKGVFQELKAIAAPDSNMAIFVPEYISVMVETAWGDVLHTNLTNAAHGSGDYLICRPSKNGTPNLTDVWVVNGKVFPNTYDMSRAVVVGTVTSVTDSGSVVTDVPASRFADAGFEYGDVLRVTVAGKTLEIPYCVSPTNVDLGGMLVDAHNGDITLCRNEGRFVKECVADAGDAVRFEIADKAGYLAEFEARNVDDRRTDVREDYDSDETFANFRAVTVGNIADGVLYRSSSPVDPALGRSTFADALAREAGVATILDLTDTEASYAGYAGAADTYAYTADTVKLGMGVDVTDADFAAKLKTGLQYMMSHKGPYLIHCAEGKDQTGYAVMVLEALMGGSFEQITADYMKSYENYYHVSRNTDNWKKLAQSTVVAALVDMTGAQNEQAMRAVNLSRAAEGYLTRRAGLSGKEVATLKEILSGQRKIVDVFQGSAVSVSKYGNVLTDIPTAGFEVGDVLTVELAAQKEPVSAPYCTAYADVEQGQAVVIATEDGNLQLAINRGDFATTYGVGTKNADDESYTLGVKKGVTVYLKEKGGYLEELALGALDDKRTNVREDYPSDEAFANFWEVTAGGITAGRLYRTSSPIDPEAGRSAYADKLLRNAGVKAVLNLADSEQKMKGYEGYGDTYYSTLRIKALNMGVDTAARDFNLKLKEGLVWLADQEGPWAIHCTEGKDRAGFVAALLECLCGATVQEVTEDYMRSFENYFFVEKGSEQWDYIAKRNIEKTLLEITGAEDAEELAKTDLAKAAENYLNKKVGMTLRQVEKLRSALTK